MGIIEKTYKHVIPTPKGFFDSFRKKYSNRSLPDDWYDSRGWTQTVLEIFEEIGLDLGYKPRREYLNLDMIYAARHDDISLIAVAIEHENGNLDDVIDDELRKLMDVKAHLKVLMFYPGMPVICEDEVVLAEIIDKIRSVNLRILEEKYLIITPVIKKKDKVYAEAVEVFAVSVSPDGKWEDLGSFAVEYKGKVS